MCPFDANITRIRNSITRSIEEEIERNIIFGTSVFNNYRPLTVGGTIDFNYSSFIRDYVPPMSADISGIITT